MLLVWQTVLLARLPGTHWVAISEIRRLAPTVSDVYLKLVCFQSNSTHSILNVLKRFLKGIASSQRNPVSQLPYGITPCYLPPDTSERPPPPATKLILDLSAPEEWKAELTVATRQCTDRESNSRSQVQRPNHYTTESLPTYLQLKYIPVCVSNQVVVDVTVQRSQDVQLLIDNGTLPGQSLLYSAALQHTTHQTMYSVSHKNIHADFLPYLR